MIKQIFVFVILSIVATTACTQNIEPISPMAATVTPVAKSTPTYMPTVIPTSIPTVTKIPVKTQTPEKIVGIDIPVYSKGVDLKVYMIKKLDSYVSSDKSAHKIPDRGLVTMHKRLGLVTKGEIITPKPGEVMYDIWAMSLNAKAYQIGSWPITGDVVNVTGSNGKIIYWTIVNYPSSSAGPGLVDWIFIVPEDVAINTLHLPGDVEIDISSLMP
jgi:hypothetical protein